MLIIKIMNALVLQTWLDIAIQYTGSVTNAYAIAYANGGRSVTDDITPGEVLVIPSGVSILNKTVAFLESKNIAPATGIATADLGMLNPDLGIGTMIIESTFIVAP